MGNGSNFTLAGCVNDAKLIRATLVDKFNFERGNIVELHDEAATRNGILAEMDKLVTRVSKNDIVVFHYSGHGHTCSVKTSDTDEGSGRDNCLLPYDDSIPIAVSDTYPEGKEYREIRDDKINEWLQRLAKKTKYITLIFDACHSGTMTRSANSSTARTVPASVRNQPAAAAVKKKSGKKSAGGWLTLSNNYVVMSGCRDTQTSKEKFFREGDTRFKHGVLTYKLIGAMAAAKPGTTYRDVFELASIGVAAEVDEQNPQIEGMLDRELFGIRDIEPLRYVPVTSVKGQQIIVRGGAAHGLRTGSRWEVYPPGTKLTDNVAALGVLEISKVRALSSTATVISNSAPIVAAARCIEIESVVSNRLLSVAVDSLNTRQLTAIKSKIEKSKLLTVAPSARIADIIAKVAKPGEAVPGHTMASSGSVVTVPTWVFVEDDKLAMPLHAISEIGVTKLLIDNLEKIAKYKNTLSLHNPISKLKVAFNLYHRKTKDDLVLVNGGAKEFVDGDKVLLEITNNDTRPVFFSVLVIAPTKEIAHAYPHRKASEELSPGKTVRKRVTLRVDKNAPEGASYETCKVFFTSSQSDFSWLNQGATRSAGTKSKSGVAALDAAIKGVPNTRASSSNTRVPTAGANASDEDWAAISRTYGLKSLPR